MFADGFARDASEEQSARTHGAGHGHSATESFVIPTARTAPGSPPIMARLLGTLIDGPTSWNRWLSKDVAAAQWRFKPRRRKPVPE